MKLLMIDNLTVKEKKRKLKGDICLKNILIKMRNIEVFKKIKPYIKFSKKWCPVFITVLSIDSLYLEKERTENDF